MITILPRRVDPLLRHMVGKAAHPVCDDSIKITITLRCVACGRRNNVEVPENIHVIPDLFLAHFAPWDHRVGYRYWGELVQPSGWFDKAWKDIVATSNKGL